MTFTKRMPSVLIRFIYTNDSSANCAPSIHVIYSAAAHAAIARYNNLRQRVGWLNVVSLILSVLCILSTVFIKQHSVIDLTLGLLLSGLLYLLIYGQQNARYRRAAYDYYEGITVTLGLFP